jgi:hypothetical protein
MMAPRYPNVPKHPIPPPKIIKDIEEVEISDGMCLDFIPSGTSLDNVSFRTKWKREIGFNANEGEYVYYIDIDHGQIPNPEYSKQQKEYEEKLKVYRKQYDTYQEKLKIYQIENQKYLKDREERERAAKLKQYKRLKKELGK